MVAEDQEGGGDIQTRKKKEERKGASWDGLDSVDSDG